jgi:hypothetical protein
MTVQLGVSNHPKKQKTKLLPIKSKATLKNSPNQANNFYKLHISKSRKQAIQDKHIFIKDIHTERGAFQLLSIKTSIFTR